MVSYTACVILSVCVVWNVCSYVTRWVGIGVGVYVTTVCACDIVSCSFDESRELDKAIEGSTLLYLVFICIA